MYDMIRLLEYSIYVLENIEYWEAKRKFKYPCSTFTVWSMIAVKQGRFKYSIRSVEGEATAGDILFVPPNTEFTREIIEPLSFFFIRFMHSDIAVPNEARILHLLHERFGYRFRTPEQDRLLSNFRQLLSLHERNEKRNHQWVTHYVSDIWLLFCKELELPEPGMEASHDTLVHAVKDWIERDACRDIKLRDLAKQFDLQPIQLTRRFQKAFGISPSSYLYTIRIEKAKSLLIETDYTIDHIARLCGYHNGFYFSRIFTQYTKMNPSVFRKIHAIHTL